MPFRIPTPVLTPLLLLTAVLGGPAPAPAQVPVDTEMALRLIDEGMERSQALDLFHTLTDVYGPRLTGSPEYDRAAEWARDRFAEWGLADARLEPFEFGRGWTLDKLSTEMIAPRYAPLIAYAEAWTPSLDGVAEGPIVYVGESSADEIRAMSTQLRGAIVFTHQPQQGFRDEDRPQPGLSDDPIRTGNPPRIPVQAALPNGELRELLQEAGAAVLVRPSHYRDGTVGVLGNRSTPDDAVPSVILSAEQYNLLVRLAQRGETPGVRIELRTRYDDETRTFNVLADIPGTDPEVGDEVVLVGGHLDSWHTAVGATDNGDGVLAVMEAARLLAAVGAQPRRTIRFALWSGEEQGLLGARAYIEQHLSDEAARDRFSVYLNDDPGSGGSLGFYMEENEPAKALFDAWLEPLSDLGVTRNIIESIGSTDHVPFNQAGLPGFNVIKDFEAYDERTRHTNADYPERMSEDELKQQAIFLAHFAWQAAQMEGRMPRTGG
ncbi:MAG: M20/M25/M40 family metallo-hydrolase [Gemmatimonadetes bacterium]|nr:M20/M25/M40 family metallo-hydrolase [Gemmatimonadota bacterium]